jgi:hypothetical protein
MLAHSYFRHAGITCGARSLIDLCLRVSFHGYHDSMVQSCCSHVRLSRNYKVGSTLSIDFRGNRAIYGCTADVVSE